MKKNIFMALVLMSGVAGIQAMEQEPPSGVVPLSPEKAAQMAKQHAKNDKELADKEKAENAEHEEKAVLHLRHAYAELLGRTHFDIKIDERPTSPHTFMKTFIDDNLQPIPMAPHPFGYQPNAGLSPAEQGVRHAEWVLNEHKMVVPAGAYCPQN